MCVFGPFYQPRNQRGQVACNPRNRRPALLLRWDIHAYVPRAASFSRPSAPCRCLPASPRQPAQRRVTTRVSSRAPIVIWISHASTKPTTDPSRSTHNQPRSTPSRIITGAHSADQARTRIPPTLIHLSLPICPCHPTRSHPLSHKAMARAATSILLSANSRSSLAASLARRTKLGSPSHCNHTWLWAMSWMTSTRTTSAWGK